MEQPSFLAWKIVILALDLLSKQEALCRDLTADLNWTAFELNLTFPISLPWSRQMAALPVSGSARCSFMFNSIHIILSVLHKLYNIEDFCTLEMSSIRHGPF